MNRKFGRRPASVLFSLLQPVVWLVLIGAVLDRAGLRVDDTRFMTFFLPTAIVTAIAYAALQGGIGAALDLESGVPQRLVLCGARPFDVMLGRWLSDASKALSQVALLLALGAGLGAGFARTPSALALLAAVVVALTMVGLGAFNLLALAAGDGETTFLGGLVVMPFVLMVSEAFVPARMLPRSLAVLAAVNPASYGLAAIRGAMAGAVVGPALTATALGAAGVAMLALLARRRTRGVFRRDADRRT